MRTKVKQAILGSVATMCACGFSGAAMADYLDYGLYWFEGNNASVKAVEHDGTVNNVPSNYYSDNKKTMILFHGWQNGSSQNGYNREGFYFSYADVQLAQAWKDKGWNVGLFYWNQFADEGEVKDAEAKIWSAQGPRGMRYRQSDGSYSTLQSSDLLTPQNQVETMYADIMTQQPDGNYNYWLNQVYNSDCEQTLNSFAQSAGKVASDYNYICDGKSVGRIAFEQVSAALANNTSGNIRFAGHSLGNQLATYTAKQIYDANSAGPAMPNRIELLDPFWSKNGKSYLGDADGNGSNDWTGERVRWYLGEMISTHDIAVTWYKGSAILDLWIGDANRALEDIVTFVHPALWYLSSVEIATKHVHTKDIYLMSMKDEPPAEVTIGWFNRRNQTGNIGPSASTCDARIKEMMVDDLDWTQVEGRYTPDTSDDMFEVKGNFNANAQTEDCR